MSCAIFSCSWLILRAAFIIELLIYLQLYKKTTELLGKEKKGALFILLSFQ